MSHKPSGLMNWNDIRQQYPITKSAIKRFLPRATRVYRSGPNRYFLWDPDEVAAALSTPEAKAYMEEVQRVRDKQEAPDPTAQPKRDPKARQRERKKQARSRKRQRAREKREAEERRREQEAIALREHLLQFDISALIRAAQNMDRRFILHCGPTNSGKTYSALEALKNARSGCYLGPLRLLALEVFDTLNGANCPCSLLTGEESIEVPFSNLTASTIEMCDFQHPVEVAVIDEAQLMADRSRGGHWLNALLRVPAREVHVCVAPEGLGLVERLIQQTGSPCEVHHCQRLTPLNYAGTTTARAYRTAQPGDAFIAFSRKAVLGIAAELESHGIHASVIYGALPPQSRREEVRKFSAGENTVVAATDAIGMGVSLPIRRIIFCQTSKYDGLSYRFLTPTEIKQVAGRAGRFGKYDEGLVLTMDSPELIRGALESDVEPFTTITIPFPSEALNGRFPLLKLLEGWDSLPPVPGFTYESMADAKVLYRALATQLGDLLDSYPEEEILRYITCPADSKNPVVVGHWVDLATALLGGLQPPYPSISTDTLTDCEDGYKLLDLQRLMLNRAGIRIDVTEQKREIEERINQLLSQDKTGLHRTCSRCGKKLPPTVRFNVCNRCFEKERLERELLKTQKRRY